MGILRLVFTPGQLGFKHFCVGSWLDVLPCPSRGARASASSAHCCARGTWLPAAAHGLKSSPALTPQSNSCESCVWLRSASLSALCPILIAVSGSLCQRMPSTWWGGSGSSGEIIPMVHFVSSFAVPNATESRVYHQVSQGAPGGLSSGSGGVPQ